MNILSLIFCTLNLSATPITSTNLVTTEPTGHGNKNEMALIVELMKYLPQKNYSGTLENNQNCELEVSSIRHGEDLLLRLTVDANQVQPQRILNFKIVSYDKNIETVHASMSINEQMKTKKLKAHTIIQNEGFSIYQLSLEVFDDNRLKSIWILEDHKNGRQRPAAHCIFEKNKFPL